MILFADGVPALLMQKPDFFFEPGQLGLRRPISTPEVMQLPVMLRFPRGFFFLALILEQLAEVFQRLFFHLWILVRMDTRSPPAISTTPPPLPSFLLIGRRLVGRGGTYRGRVCPFRV